MKEGTDDMLFNYNSYNTALLLLHFQEFLSLKMIVQLYSLSKQTTVRGFLSMFSVYLEYIRYIKIFIVSLLSL